VRRPCGHPSCLACREGRQDFCYTGDYSERGIKRRHGFMTEFIVEEEQYLNVVPRELRDVGVLVEPLTIAEKSLEQLSMVQQRLPWACTGDAGKGPGRRCRAVVLGAGPVGLLGAMALRVAGFEITVYSRSSRPDETNEIVKGIGGRFIPAESHSVAEMAAAAGPIDVVYEAVGASGVAFEVIKQLGPNGVFIFTGVPGRKGPIEIDTDHIMRDVVLNNQAIIGSVNAPPQAFQSAIAHLGTFVQRWPQAIRSIITARFSIQQALEPLIAPGGGTKSIVEVSA
jgi:threonine dehydrogenase-like Zn-dependent dehydrogenase